jgi:hypothetical protein
MAWGGSTVKGNNQRILQVIWLSLQLQLWQELVVQLSENDLALTAEASEISPVKVYEIFLDVGVKWVEKPGEKRQDD